ncbi:hypothetical protein GGI05_005646, partial [Coemansia sp. RSA 2603]
MNQRVVLSRVASSLARNASPATPRYTGALVGFARFYASQQAPTNVHERRVSENKSFSIPHQTWGERDATQSVWDFSAKTFFMTEIARGFWTVLMQYLREPYTLHYPFEK